MRQAMYHLDVATNGIGTTEITSRVVDWVARQGIETGLLTVFLPHTSASLLLQENADPAVRRDLDAFFQRLAPEGSTLYEHSDEGPDDMPAHIRSALGTVQISIPVCGGEPTLGTWQGLYLYEHRRMPHRRQIVLHLIGDESTR